jgi:hypothetical protein
VTIAICARRMSVCLAVLGLAVFGLSGSALASPTIAFKVRALPIPGFPGTGDILGAGAVLQGEGTISGSEYGGSPPPITEIKVFAPVGVKLSSQGFATCSSATLESHEVQSCPKKSIAGPKGFAVGVVSFGGDRVKETASVQPFFAPGGNPEFFVEGTTPVVVEIIATGHVVGSAPPFGLEFLGEVPLIETVPGALDASFLEGTIRVGTAYKQGRKTISYITMPKTCPKGGFPVKVEVGFLGGTTAGASYKMPCPKR